MCPCDVACKTVRLVKIHMQSYGVSHVIPNDAAAQKEEPF